MRPRLVKLVRDRIGQHLADTTVSYEPIESQGELVEALRAKLIEEAVEYLQDPTLGELADVLDVVVALAHTDLQVPLHALEAERQAKRRERGGFDKGIGMYVQTNAPARHEGQHV